MKQIKNFKTCVQKFLVLVVGVVVGFNPSTLLAKENNAEFKQGINQEFETLNPLIVSSAAGAYILYFVYRPLVYMDEHNQWQPMMAKEIPNEKSKTLSIISENGQKKMQAIWELKDNVKWSDGTPVTCKDAHFAWEMGKNKNISLPTRDAFDSIESISWDEKTPTKCVYKYNKVSWDFFANTPDPMPAHMESGIFKKWSGEREGYDRNTLYQKDPTKKGLWNGPYVISESKLGSHVILTPNPYFYGEKPKIKKILIRIIPNTGTLEANLRSKNIDSIARLGLSLDQAIEFEKKIKSEKLPYDIQFRDGITYGHIDVNLDHPILKDIQVRRALSYGLNKKEIVDSIFEGKVAVAHSFTSPLDRMYTDDSKVIFRYDVERRKAKKLLEEAGWKLQTDGFRYKNKQKLSFKILSAAGAKVNDQILAIIQNQWKELGVDLVIKTETARSMFSETLPKRNYDMCLFSWGSFPEQSPESTLHSKNISRKENTWTGQNYTGFKSAKVDKLIDDYATEFDFEKRKKIMHEIMREYTEIIPVIPVYFRGDNAVLPKGFKNFLLSGHKYYESLKAEYWEL